ncbi:MAG: hypothetical protein HY826_10700 [Actinobacteria bacterium]|nr:hypothetical protein [Actinomycetota bacterium]
MKPQALPAAISVRGALAAFLAVSLVVGVVTCRSQTTPVPDTVGIVVDETTPTTLLSFVPDTDPPDPTAEPTVPPGTIFGGDPCVALVAEDFAATAVAGLGPAVLVDTSPLSEDRCGFLVAVADQQFNISVQVVTVREYGKAPADDEDRVAITGVGRSAYSVARSDTEFEVWVQVDSGYFVVVAPDAASASRLARRAAQRADELAII